MGAPGYPDPVSALDAVVACLDMPSNITVHRGSLGSGETIPCCAQPCEGDGCNHGVLRVETGQRRPKDGAPSPMILMGKCAQPIVMEIIVSYRECFPSNLGKAATPTVQLTAAGMSIVMSWWDAMLRIRQCSSPQQQRLRFVSGEDSSPLGQCAGWTLTLECDLIDCREAPTSTVVGVGMAGEGNQTI